MQSITKTIPLIILALALISISAQSIELFAVKGKGECANVKRVNECLNMIERQAVSQHSALKRLSDDVLSISLDSGAILRLENKAPIMQNGAERDIHDVVTYQALEVINEQFILVFKRYYEGFSYALISLSTGAQASLKGYPVISPNKGFMIVAEGGLDSEHSYPVLQLYQLEQDKLIAVYDATPQRWEPDHVVWISDTKVSFIQKQYNPNRYKNRHSPEFIKKSMILDLTDKNKPVIKPAK